MKSNLETNRREYKQSLSDELEKEIVAFLNANGGELYIGMQDDGKPIGVNNPDTIQLKIKDRLINNIRPSIMGLFDIHTQMYENKAVLIITVASGLETPYYIKQKGLSESGCYIRIGSSAQSMTEEMIERLLQNRHPVSLANMISRHQDLTFNQMKIFYEGKHKILNKHFAKTLDFLTLDGHYNYLAYLFADNNFISVRVAKYWGTDKVELRELNDYGECSLTKAVNAVLDKFEIENITQARIAGLGPRQEKRLVDNNALREAIINAFAHNDYSTGETPIFEIYSDRFEITSYGGLVAGLSVEEFFEGVSRLRNPEIMRIFRDIELVERLGSGMHRILKVYDRSIFTITKNIIRVSFKLDNNIGNNTKDSKKNNSQKTVNKIVAKNSLKNGNKKSGKKSSKKSKTTTKINKK
ncbi:MAG: putative DNA binding domain-containing protein [Planctomycetaceae bacterium]|jgi:predicted HTH transcriptional regulator|nr:putative DNA binding domain-containing protein [Planctomycetaceae bacterium]